MGTRYFIDVKCPECGALEEGRLARVTGIGGVMKLNWRLTATIDRLISNIPAACKLLVEEGHVSLAGQLSRDCDNLVYYQEHGGLMQREESCLTVEDLEQYSGSEIHMLIRGNVVAPEIKVKVGEVDV